MITREALSHAYTALAPLLNSQLREIVPNTSEPSRTVGLRALALAWCNRSRFRTTRWCGLHYYFVSPGHPFFSLGCRGTCSSNICSFLRRTSSVSFSCPSERKMIRDFEIDFYGPSTRLFAQVFTLIIRSMILAAGTIYNHQCPSLNGQILFSCTRLLVPKTCVLQGDTAHAKYLASETAD